jgi:hypothetical protein
MGDGHSMSSDVLQKANRAIQTGDKAAARRLLAEILYKEPQNAQAWLLMSSAVENIAQRRECLQRVLEIDAQNQDARAGIAWLDGETTRSTSTLESQLAREQTKLPAAHAPRSPIFSLRAGFPATPLSPPTHATEDAYDHHKRVQIESSRRQELAPGMASTTPRLSLDERQRKSGYRNIMLAGAMTLSLMCGLVILVATLTSVVPEAQASIRPTPAPILYNATLWCPPCEQGGSKIILWEKVGDGISRGAKVGELDHGTPVSVLAETWSDAEGRLYFRVQAQGQTGWVPDTFIQK